MKAKELLRLLEDNPDAEIEFLLGNTELILVECWKNRGRPAISISLSVERD